MCAIVGTLLACANPPALNPPINQGQAAPEIIAPKPPQQPSPTSNSPAVDSPPIMAHTDASAAAPLLQAKSRWQPVRWTDLPGFEADALHEAWNAWIRSCERPSLVWQNLCPEIRRLSIADGALQRAWMREKLQPYRVEPLAATTEGLLTSYYEPVLEARRASSATHRVALWQPPAGLALRKPWYSRKEIDTLPEAQAALRGKEIAYLADPVDALILQIQGSGKLRIIDTRSALSLGRPMAARSRLDS
jgi:membrane-bound lytic murein transglycosylase A